MTASPSNAHGPRERMYVVPDEVYPDNEMANWAKHPEVFYSERIPSSDQNTLDRVPVAELAGQATVSEVVQQPNPETTLATADSSSKEGKRIGLVVLKSEKNATPGPSTSKPSRSRRRGTDQA